MGCGAVDEAAPPLIRGRGFDPKFCYEDDCTKEDPLSQESFHKLAAPLPYSKQHHSKLVCYITKELMNSENPPLMLPHGYVYNTKSFKEMAKRNMMAELNVLGKAIPATNSQNILNIEYQLGVFCFHLPNNPHHNKKKKKIRGNV
ncbi:hypothetical protein P3S68_030812 [Capsicum galapagoense]